MESIQSRLIEIFNAVFPSTATLNHEKFDLLTRDDVQEWDSLQQLNLFTAIEQEFGIKISDEDALQFTSFPYILNFLSENS